LPRRTSQASGMSMGLSLVLHGLAVVLLLVAGAAGSSTTGETTLLVELAVAPAADTANHETEPSAEQQSARNATNEADEAVPKHAEQLTEAVEPTSQPTAVIELAPAEEPPPLDASELKRDDPPKPKPQAPPERQRAPKAPSQRVPPARDFGSSSSAQQAAAGFLAAAPVVWEGKARYRLPPKPAAYPARAIELGQQGEVLVRVRLDTGGGAVEIVIFRSSGSELLDRAALAAVREWQFLPAVRDGRPVAAWVEIPVRFQLR